MESIVSIIVPTYNRAPLILETLESVRSQTYSAIELIVVDDGSTDQTEQVVKEWMRKNNVTNCTYISLARNTGKSSAVNVGFENCHGDYVMVFDSDDILLPDAIFEEVLYLKQHPDVGIVFADAYVMNGSKKTNERLSIFQKYDAFDDLEQQYGNMLLRGNAIISSTVLMRLEVVKNVGGLDVDLKYTHDWDYWIRAAKKYKMGYLGRPVMYYRTNTIGASSAHRLGTFKEICILLLKASSSEKKNAVLKALLYQTKYNAWLAYHDGNPFEMIGIVFVGAQALAKCIILRCER